MTYSLNAHTAYGASPYGLYPPTPMRANTFPQPAYTASAPATQYSSADSVRFAHQNAYTAPGFLNTANYAAPPFNPPTAPAHSYRTAWATAPATLQGIYGASANPFNPFAQPQTQAPFAVGKTPFPQATAQPTVQNYYYTNPIQGNSQKKNIKKFLMITGAVMTGVIATAGLALGAVALIAPSQLKLFQKLGAKPFQKGIKLLDLFKDPNKSISVKLSESLKIFSEPKPASTSGGTAFHKLKNWYQKHFDKEAYQAAEAAKAKAEAAASAKAKLESQAKINEAATQFFEILGQLPEDVQTQVSDFLRNMGAESISKAFENPTVRKHMKEMGKEMIGESMSLRNWLPWGKKAA